jgi:predicted Zn-dependent protease
MRKILFTLLSVLASTAAFAQQADPEALAKIVLTNTANAIWATAQLHAVAETHPVVKRVRAVFEKLEKTDSLEGVQLVVTDLSEKDQPAMAIYGNRILIQYRFAQSLSDNALGFTLGHELGHLHARDNETRVITALIAAKINVPDAGAVMNAAINSAAFSIMTRKQEILADEFGVDLADRAGFDGRAGLKEAVGHSQSDLTHPSGDERVATVF